MKHVRQLKYNPIMEEAKLMEANPCYVNICLQNGKETLILLWDLASLMQNYYREIQDWLTQPKLWDIRSQTEKSDT